MNGVRKRLEGLGIAWKSEYNDVVRLLEKRADEYIKNTCNLSAVPKGLEYIRIDMIAGMLLKDLKAFGALTEVDFERVVSSVHEGDTTVNFAAGTDPAQVFDSYVTRLCEPDLNELIRYRRLVW